MLILHQKNRLERYEATGVLEVQKTTSEAYNGLAMAYLEEIRILQLKKADIKKKRENVAMIQWIELFRGDSLKEL